LTVSKLWPIIVKFSLAIGVLHFSALAGVISCQYPENFTSPETRMIVLPDTEDRFHSIGLAATKHPDLKLDDYKISDVVSTECISNVCMKLTN